MEKIFKALSSRTFWTAVVLFVVAGFPSVQQFIPANLVFVIEAILTILVGYFKVTPSKNY